MGTQMHDRPAPCPQTSTEVSGIYVYRILHHIYRQLQLQARQLANIFPPSTVKNSNPDSGKKLDRGKCRLGIEEVDALKPDTQHAIDMLKRMTAHTR